KRTNDGGYIIVGTTRSNDGDLTFNPYSTSSTWLLKLDVNGNMEWSKIFGDFEILSSSISSVYPTTDGGYILVKVLNDGSNPIQVVYKLNESGEIVWQNTYNEFDLFCYVQQTTNNGYIVLIGHIIMKLNESGETEWETE